MGQSLPAAVLLAAAEAAPDILDRFPLEAVASSLAAWPKRAGSGVRISVSATTARGQVRRMSVEKAAVIARHADGDEETFQALWADRRITVRRELAANPAVPVHLRLQWLKSRIDPKKATDWSDRTTVALIAGVLAGDRAAEDIEEAGLTGEMENANFYRWQDILGETAPDRIWAVIRNLKLDAESKLKLLWDRAGDISEDGRPERGELAALLQAVLSDGGRIGAGSPTPSWLDDLCADALAALPEQLAGAAYAAAENVSHRSWPRNGRYSRQVRPQLLENLLRSLSEGRDIPVPDRIHPAHLAEVGRTAPELTAALDEKVLEAVVAGLSLFGPAGSQLQTAQESGCRLDPQKLTTETWVERKRQLQTSGIRHGDALRIVAVADAAVALTDPESVRQLPEPLLQICRDHSRDVTVLERLLDSGAIAAGDLAERISEEGAYDLDAQTICRLVTGGRLSLEDAVAGLDIRALPHLQRGMVPHRDEVEEEPEAMDDREGAAGLGESFRQVPAEKRLLLLAGLISRRDDTARWAASADALAPLLQESLSGPNGSILRQIAGSRNREASPAAVLSAAVLMLMLAGLRPEERTGIDGDLVAAGGPQLRKQLGRSMAARLVELAPALPKKRMRQLLLQAAGHLAPDDLTSAAAAALPVAETLRQLLGEDPDTWRLFTGMVEGWEGSLLMLADAVKQLTDGD